MQLLVTPGAGARAIDGSTTPPGDGVMWWDVGPGEDAPPFVDADLLRSLTQPTLMPRCEQVPNGLAIVVHSLDEAGHLVQLGILIGERSVTTVHSAFNDAVATDSFTKETAPVAARLVAEDAGVGSASDLASMILVELASTLRGLLEDAAGRAGKLDRRVRDERIRDQEAFLHDLFEVRRDLFTVRNRLAQTTEVVQDAAHSDPAFTEVVDTFERLLRMCDGERDFFSGVIGFFEQKINVKINFASERLALIAALVLPLSAVSGILGMNTIVQDRTNVPLTVIFTSLMIAMVVALLIWSKRKDWW